MKYFYLLLLVISLSSCTSLWERPLKIESFKDPDYQEIKFKKILINHTDDNFNTRKIIEERAQKAFKYAGLICEVYHILFYPTRSYTEEEQIQIMKEMGIDAVLNIEFNSLEYEETIDEEGNIEKKPFSHLSFTLVDIANGRKAWIADVTNGGNAFEDLEDIVKEIFKKVAFKLINDSLIYEYIEIEPVKPNIHSPKN